MSISPVFLDHYELVKDVYGCWPSFHDAEVHSIFMDRTHVMFGEISDPRVELVIHCLDIKNNVNTHLIHLEFSDVRDLTLAGFNHQNAILGLLFEELPGDSSGNTPFKVTLDHAHGVEGSFIASRGKVRSVTPCK